MNILFPRNEFFFFEISLLSSWEKSMNELLTKGDNYSISIYSHTHKEIIRDQKLDRNGGPGL